MSVSSYPLIFPFPHAEKEKVPDRFRFYDYFTKKKETAEFYDFNVSPGDRFVAKTLLDTAKRDNRLSIDSSVLSGEYRAAYVTCKKRERES